MKLSNIQGFTGFRLRLQKIQNLAFFRKSGQISSWICQIPAQLQYVQLITDKTNTAGLTAGAFLIKCYSEDENTKPITAPQILSKTALET